MNLSKVKIFGCTTYYNNLQNKISKFEPNSRKVHYDVAVSVEFF